MVLQQKAKITFSIWLFWTLLVLLTNAFRFEFGGHIDKEAYYLYLGYPTLFLAIAVVLYLWCTNQLNSIKLKTSFAVVPQTRRQKISTSAWVGASLFLFSFAIALARTQRGEPMVAGNGTFTYWAIFCASAWPVIWKLDASYVTKFATWAKAVFAGVLISIGGAFVIAVMLKDMFEGSPSLFMPLAVISMLLPLIGAYAAYVVSDRSCKKPKAVI